MATNIQLLKDGLKNEGLRYTSQRQIVWDEICKTDDHLEAEEIYFKIKMSGEKVSRATVYRTIDVLVNNNLVRKLELGDCLLYTSPSPRDPKTSRMPSSA